MGTKVYDNGGDYEPIPTGMHRAMLVNYYDVGLQPGFEGGKPQEKVVMLWELEPRNSNNKRFTICKTYTKSIGEKSNLGSDLVSWRGRPFTDDERKGFDLDRIKGKPCQLNIVLNPKGKTKVDRILPPVMERDPRGNARIAQHWNIETDPDYVPNFVQAMIDHQIIPGYPAQSEPRMREPGEDFEDDIPGEKGGDIF